MTTESQLEQILSAIQGLERKIESITPKPDAPNLMDVKTLADHLGMHPETIYPMIGKRITGIKVGRSWRFDLDQVRLDLASFEHTATRTSIKRRMAAKQRSLR